MEGEIERSNVLVHVEAFDKDSARSTRLSLSTKIPEYMMSNRCILAIGPATIASMQYLQKNEVALCINTIENLDLKIIKQRLFDNRFREGMAESARELAIKKHSISDIQQELYSDIMSSLLPN